MEIESGFGPAIEFDSEKRIVATLTSSPVPWGLQCPVQKIAVQHESKIFTTEIGSDSTVLSLADSFFAVMAREGIDSDDYRYECDEATRLDWVDPEIDPLGLGVYLRKLGIEDLKSDFLSLCIWSLDKISDVIDGVSLLTEKAAREAYRASIELQSKT